MSGGSEPRVEWIAPRPAFSATVRRDDATREQRGRTQSRKVGVSGEQPEPASSPRPPRRRPITAREPLPPRAPLPLVPGAGWGASGWGLCPSRRPRGGVGQSGRQQPPPARGSVPAPGDRWGAAGADGRGLLAPAGSEGLENVERRGVLYLGAWGGRGSPPRESRSASPRSLTEGPCVGRDQARSSLRFLLRKILASRGFVGLHTVKHAWCLPCTGCGPETKKGRACGGEVSDTRRGLRQRSRRQNGASRGHQARRCGCALRPPMCSGAPALSAVRGPHM